MHKHATPADPYITVAEAARRLGVSRPTVLMWASKGLLSVEMIAGRPVVVAESVDRRRAELAAESPSAVAIPA